MLVIVNQFIDQKKNEQIGNGINSVVKRIFDSSKHISGMKLMLSERKDSRSRKNSIIAYKKQTKGGTPQIMNFSKKLTESENYREKNHLFNQNSHIVKDSVFKGKNVLKGLEVIAMNQSKRLNIPVSQNDNEVFVMSARQVEDPKIKKNLFQFQEFHKIHDLNKPNQNKFKKDKSSKKSKYKVVFEDFKKKVKEMEKVINLNSGNESKKNNFAVFNQFNIQENRESPKLFNQAKNKNSGTKKKNHQKKLRLNRSTKFEFDSDNKNSQETLSDNSDVLISNSTRKIQSRPQPSFLEDIDKHPKNGNFFHGKHITGLEKSINKDINLFNFSGVQNLAQSRKQEINLKLMGGPSNQEINVMDNNIHPLNFKLKQNEDNFEI